MLSLESHCYCSFSKRKCSERNKTKISTEKKNDLCAIFFWILDLEGIHRKWSQCQRFNAIRESYHRKNSNFQLSSHSADKVYRPHSPFV